ncbi:hypothetical protein GCM10007167_16160 [Vulcaniibacterium thermophilum]|jgi:hypothetical protein|uniref:Uncharacterized protein n=1 Tax=Vulcaniibacterium thermophilum TaxID=1169913 RepID=A0A918Z2N9_9GAMM|nr:hypothetical protein GCM10007167_16160 [Vulcaniibacterium thermophilum]
MGRKRYHRRRGSPAGQIIRDTTQIANRMTWKACLLLGAILFSAFYWLIPAWLDGLLVSQASSPFAAAVESVIGRRVRMFRLIGIAVGLVCVFFAVRNYYTRQHMGRPGRNATGFLARLFARSLD